jgi:hypothetical protein
MAIIISMQLRQLDGNSGATLGLLLLLMSSSAACRGILGTENKSP